MAKLEKKLSGDFDKILKKIIKGVQDASVSATLEDSSNFFASGARCSVCVFERYSYAGGNRVSMNVTLFQGDDGIIHVSAITSGGSQATFFKMNTLGEETFLDTLRTVLLHL